MIRKITVLLVLLFVFKSCSFETPTTFSKDVLNDTFLTLGGKQIYLKEILAQHKGKKIMINVWATWCKDCVVSIPDLKEFQEKNSELTYVFFSTDRSVFRWKKAVEKYQLKGNHYYMKRGMNSAFGDFLNSNWIPRYLVVDEKGDITLFKAKKITDSRIVEAIKK